MRGRFQPLRECSAHGCTTLYESRGGELCKSCAKAGEKPKSTTKPLRLEAQFALAERDAARANRAAKERARRWRR